MSGDNNPSVDAFLRFVQERFGEFRTRLDDLMAALATDDKQQKMTRALAALEAGNSLRQALSHQDQPGWLQPLINTLQKYVAHQGNPSHGTQLFQTIGLHYAAAHNHQWAFDFTDDKGFDFDGVFRKYEAESRISELFDKIAEILEQVVQCDGVDSRKMIHTLETIIATLRKNRNGSYFSVMGTWNFLGTYLRNLAWNSISEVPVLKTVVVSLRETLDELNKEMESVHDKMRTDLNHRLDAEFPVLEYRVIPLPSPLAVGVDRDIDVLHSDTTPAVDQESQSL